MEPAGLLRDVTQHLQWRPSPLLQLHELLKALGGGHAAVGYAENAGVDADGPGSALLLSKSWKLPGELEF